MPAPEIQGPRVGSYIHTLILLRRYETAPWWRKALYRFRVWKEHRAGT